MTKFTDNLWRDLAHEHGQDLTQAVSHGPGRARRPGSRVLAGSTLAVAGAGAAIALVLTSASGTPAFAVTENANGTIAVSLSQTQALPQANQKLASLGLHEAVEIVMGSGPASVSGPVTCTPERGIANQPTVTVLVGADGTQVIKPGTTAGNTGVGTWHLVSCDLASDTGGTGTGNTGNGGAG